MIGSFIFNKKNNENVSNNEINKYKEDILRMCGQMENALNYIKNQIKTTKVDDLDEWSDFHTRVRIVNKVMEDQLVIDD